MKKTTLLLCLAILLICALVAPAAAFSGAGSGTTEDPYQITSRAQLEEISSALSASYVLMNDIDLGGSSTPWTPIGSTSPFTGIFDGNGFEISNLTSSSPNLIAKTSLATISNLSIKEFNLSSSQSYSGMIGYASGYTTIDNCRIIDSVFSTTNGFAGAFVGATHTQGVLIQNSYTQNTSVTNPTYRVGGFIGESFLGNISKSYISGGSVSAGGTTSGSGGFLGECQSSSFPSKILNCVSISASITGSSSATGRLWGAGYVTSSKSYGYTSTLINGVTVTGTPTTKHGGDASSANLASQAWWQTYPEWSFTDSSAWYWDATVSRPNLNIFKTQPEIKSFTSTPSIGSTSTSYQLNAEIIAKGTITYQWQQSENGSPYTNISVDTIYIGPRSSTNISYNTTISQAGSANFRLIITNEYNETATSNIMNVFVANVFTPDTIVKQTTPDISDESTDQYRLKIQYILPESPNKLIYTDQYVAYLATGNAIYKIQSDTETVTSVSSTTGNTIQNAYLGTTNAIITDTDNITAIYNYASGTQTLIGVNNTGIIASTGTYAAVKNNSGYLNLYTVNGTLITTTSTTVTQIAANDQTNIIIGHLGSTTLYIWRPSASTITQTTVSIPSAITDIRQIIGTNQFIVTTTAKTYILAITETGTVTTSVSSTATTPLLHTQSTTADTFIGTSTNGIYIIDNTGTTIGTYTAGATLNDASIARLTGLWAVTGGDDTQAYFLTKSGTSSWTLGQTAQIFNPVSHTQISTTGTYALICSGLNLYLWKNTLAPTTLYYLNGIVISSAGLPWQNQTLTMNGETIITDSSGKFVTLVNPGTSYTFVADTTTTQYTATNSQLQTLLIQLKPNPFATAITYTAAYNSTSGNIEMEYGDTTGKTESVTWSIYDTSNKTTVYTHTGTVGTETYAVPLEDSYKNYQVTVTADRGDTSVKNTWTLTPSGSSPINLFGLDDTGKNIIFCTVLMIFGGLFGVMHSTKGALAVTALAAWMRYMELITIPWILISIAAVIAVIASLQRGGEGKV